MEVLHEIQERAKEYKTIEEWFAHIEQYTQELAKKAKRNQYNPNAISLLTMHSAKGLEFTSVFILAANEDVCPYKKAEVVEDMEMKNEGCSMWQ